jgi:hypothetical protein
LSRLFSLGVSSILLVVSKWLISHQPVTSWPVYRVL